VLDDVSSHAPRGISDLLIRQSGLCGEKRAFVFLGDGEREDTVATYAGLHGRALAVGAALRGRYPPGARALLLYPSGLAFIEAFFGCLYAGLLPVPACPPSRRTMLRTQAILADSQSSVALTTSDLAAGLESDLSAVARGILPDILPTDVLAPAPDFVPVEAQPGDIAFLQYTSGSTSNPKGVQVTHANLLHNLTRIRTCFRASDRTVGAGWLPLFHDMGLIGQILAVVHNGSTWVLMPPACFLQAPLRWLGAISRYRATVAGGPDFAYTLCVEAAQGRDLADIDLSSWEVAFSGAEQVRARTLVRFAETFSRNGFRRSSFLPAYGLAETTLLAASAARAGDNDILHVDAQALGRNEVVCRRPGEAGGAGAGLLRTTQ
jgi:acyl-CoA synthetase (AMP-forming)/AMP-acid ligase II